MDHDLLPRLPRRLVAVVLLTACGSATEPPTTRTPDLPVALISSPVNDVTQTQLVLASADGRTTRTLSTFAGPKWSVLWSPDGKRLAFTGARPDASGAYPVGLDLWVVNADGTGLQQLTTDKATGPFVWLPDGRILRQQLGASPPGWTTVPAGAGGALPIGSYNGVPVSDLAVSRDGAHVAFRSSSGVYVAAFDGTGARLLGPGVAPRWSPAGDRVAYGAPPLTDSTNWTVVIARADGTGTSVRIPTAPRTDQLWTLTWTPDGSRIAWISSQHNVFRAVTAPADGSGAPAPVVARSASATDYDLSIDWRPTATP